MCEITNTIISYFNFGNTKRHHRFQSWEKCYSHFQSKFNDGNTEIQTFDCLQLGFYLSSWGMYRASSFLLQHSFEIHRPVLTEIFNERYTDLWQYNFDNEENNDFVSLLFNLKASIINIYKEETSFQQNVTDTLVTKIILGIIGITPAYDRFFRDGCRNKNVKPFTNFSSKSYKRITEFYFDNIDSFNQAKEMVQQNTALDYPPMKLVDMYFWNIGANYNFNQIE